MLTSWPCSQRLYKLKKESDKLLGEGGHAMPAGEAATPGKAAKAKPPGSKGWHKRKADSDEDANEAPSPAKKRAPEKATTAAVEKGVRKEPEAEENTIIKAEEANSDTKWIFTLVSI
jgi:hypothetical protein